MPRKKQLERDVIFANRIFLIRCEGKNSVKVCDNFFGLIEKYEEKIRKLMDFCDVPEQVILNFKKGDKTISGLYYVQTKEVSKHLIVVDIYIRPLFGLSKKERNISLIDSFVHEVIHHKYRDENKTDAKTKEYIEKKLGLF